MRVPARDQAAIVARLLETLRQDGQQATKPTGTVCESSAEANSPGGVEISFAEHLARIGYGTDTPEGAAECVSLCHQSPGSRFSGTVSVWSDVPARAARLVEMSSMNLGFGVNALREVVCGRGTADDVSRVAAMIADLDVKPGGCPDFETARLIIAAISAVLGEDPVDVVESGHGLQPYWAVEVLSGRKLAEDTAAAKRLGRRFHALLTRIAAEHGCAVDSVFDLPRVFRVPGSVNFKDPENPVPARCFAGDGKPMTVERITAALDAAGIPQEPVTTTSSKKPRGEREPKAERPPLYAVTAAMTPGKPSPKVRTRLATALTDVAIETDRHHKTRDHTLALLRYGYNGQSGVGDALEALCRAFVFTVGPDDRVGGEPEAMREFVSFVIGAEKLLAAEPPREFGGRPEDQDDDGRRAEDDFWSQRESLAHVQRFARSRRAAPYAVLASTLRRAITLVPPHVQLPPTVGSPASVNLFTVNVGRSGQGKDIANGVGRDAVTFHGADGEVLADPDSPGIGTGEGLARVFKGHGQDQPPSCAHVEINEVSTLTALADRKGHTLVGELLKAFMGQAIGFTNSQKATTTHVRPHSYRLCLSVGAQPENAGFFLDREKDGLPQRFLWLPVVNPYALPPADGEQDFVPALRVTLPTFPTLFEGAPYFVGVPASARAMILDFHYLVEIGSPDVDPLDGHIMLVRLKVAFGLALLEGRRDIEEDDWRVAGQLIELSNRVRADMRRVVADQHRKSNARRAHDQADREAIIAEKLSEKTQKRVVDAITRKLSRVGAATRRELHQACDSSISRDFPAVFDFMLDQGELVAEEGEGMVTRYRLRSV